MRFIYLGLRRTLRAELFRKPQSQPSQPIPLPISTPITQNVLLSSQRGIALITVIIVMLTMALIGASLAELSSSVNYSVDTILDATKARYLAEAGIAHALKQLRGGGVLENSLDADGNPVYFPLGEGYYTVTFEAEEALISCTGIVNGIKKTLQLQYNVF